MARARKQTAIEPEVVASEPVTPEQWTYGAESVTLSVGDRSVSVPLSTPGTLAELCDMARKELRGG